MDLVRPLARVLGLAKGLGNSRMTRALLPSVLFTALLGLSACSNSQPAGCRSYSDCAFGYACDYWSGQCVPEAPDSECSSPEDCRRGETCGMSGFCQSGSCAVHDCVTGFECAIVDGIFACVAAGSSDAGAPEGGGAADTGTPEGGGVTDAERPDTSLPVEAASAPDGASDTHRAPDARVRRDAASGSDGAPGDAESPPSEANPQDAQADASAE